MGRAVLVLAVLLVVGCADSGDRKLRRWIRWRRFLMECSLCLTSNQFNFYIMRTVIMFIAMLAATMASAQFTGSANVLNERGQAVNRFMAASVTPDGNGSVIKYESVFVKLGQRVKYLDYTMDGAIHTIYIQRDKENRCELTTHWNGGNLVYLIFVAWDNNQQIYDRWQWFPNCEVLLRKSTATK